MTRPRREELERLDKAELIALIYEIFDAFEEKLEGLEKQVEELSKGGLTSKNSSLPPSRDHKAKMEQMKSGKGKVGAIKGHERMERKLVESPDQIIEVRARRCSCGASLEGIEAVRVIRRQITELPEVKPVVIETQQAVVVCRCCGKEVRGELPEGLESNRMFGPRLEGVVTYFQQQQHLSYERNQETLKELFGLEISQGGLACIVKRAGMAAEARVAAIQAEVRQARVVGSDETGARVNGQNWWEWVFRAGSAILHVIRPSRGLAVISEVMGEAKVDTWVSDCWSAQLKAPAHGHQLCLAHQIRNLEKLIEDCPRLAWARQMQALFRRAIHLAHRRGQLTPKGFARQVRQLEGQLQGLIDRRVKNPLAHNLLKRYRKHRDHLLVFLHDPSVPHHNNDCERALRPSVIHRKVSGGFRSQWGADTYANLASVIDSAKATGQAVFPTLVQLMGMPVLQYLGP